MNGNTALIHQFYTAFQNKDFVTMANAYADHATFSDPVFTDLNATEARAMWEMLIKRGKDLDLSFSNVSAGDESGTADWIATYTFSKTGRKVTNRIKANFRFENGKIVEHRDDFDFYAWARQAIGPAGWLLGWTAALRAQVGMNARKGLLHFMESKQQKTGGTDGASV